MENIRGQISPENIFRETTDRHKAESTAAILALKRVRARIGSGASTKTSLRSGKIESQQNTESRATTIIVVAIRKCSMTRRNILDKPDPAKMSQNVKPAHAREECGKLSQQAGRIRIGG